MWIELKKICKRECIYVFFCTTKFGYKLIKSNERWFRYDLVWEKSRRVGFLNANKIPLRKHEMVYVFADANEDDLENNRNLGLRDYFKSIMDFIDKTLKEITNEMGGCADHCFRVNSTQFGLPTEKTYNKLTEKYNLRDMPGFREYQTLKNEWGQLTYNPQKTEGKPYKRKEYDNIVGVYGDTKVIGTNNKGDRFPHSILQFPNEFEYNTYKSVYRKHKKVVVENNKGDRHPTTILKFNNPVKYFHRTQKPVDLCEWLIKTYSNEGDLVLDFTMGSGTTGIACLNTGRQFIGIEKDTDIFRVAKHRLFKHELEMFVKI